MRALSCALLALVLLLGFCVNVGAAPRIIYSHATGAEKPRVALTFDDGPHPKYTPQILEILSEYGIPATFFVVGVNAETYPNLVLREIKEGHEIGNHTYNHYHVGKLSAGELYADVQACSSVLRRITGKEIGLFRPPEGVCSDAVKCVCRDSSLSIVLWSVDTRDWAHTPIPVICENIKKNARDGSIILMHDFIGKDSPTPKALRQIIPMLLRLGYEFVTVSQLLEETP